MRSKYEAPTYKSSLNEKHKFEKFQDISKKRMQQGTLKEAVSVLITMGSSLLVGQRKDSLLYTLPGGHKNDNETVYQAAIRELHEETGLRVNELDKMGESLTDENVLVHVFAHELTTTREGARDLTTKYDPDDEVFEWFWIDTGSPLFKLVREKLQHYDNVALKMMRII